MNNAVFRRTSLLLFIVIFSFFTLSLSAQTGEREWFIAQEFFKPLDQSGRDITTALDIDGDTLVLGSNLAADHGVGNARIYERTASGEWKKELELRPETDKYAEFGYSVAIDGDTVAVGAPAFYYPSPKAAVYVYVRKNGEWIKQAKITDPTNNRTLYGWNVALSGDLLAITDGEYADTVDTIHFYRRNTNGEWVKQGKLKITDTPDQVPCEYYCSRKSLSISLDNNTLAVGGNNKVSIYRLYNGTWTLHTKMESTETDEPDFGFAVALDGNTLIASQRRPSKAYIYRLNNIDVWEEQAVFDGNPDGWYDEADGITVDLDESQGIAMMSPSYIFRRDGTGVWHITDLREEFYIDTNCDVVYRHEWARQGDCSVAIGTREIIFSNGRSYLIRPTLLTQNSGFELTNNQNSPKDWKSTQEINGSVDCNGAGHSSPCAFVFHGISAVGKKLKQKFTSQGIKAGDTLTFSAAIKAENVPSNTQIGLVKFKTKDGNKVTIPLVIVTPSAEYSTITASVQLAAKPQGDIKVELSYNGMDGTVWLDDVMLRLSQAGESQSALVPLP
jgi:hypothetical protein